MKQRMTLFMAILLIGIGLSNAQVSQVTGNVMSEEDGLPVVGASVLVKGTTVGTVTDIDGNFTISGVPASAKTLVVSFIGLQSQEVAVKPVVNVVLKSDAQALEEVVVVAYGTQSARTVTASVASIRNDALKVSIRPTTGIKPLYTTIATVTMNLIVSAAIVLLNPYVTVYISYKIPPFALSVHIPDVSTSIYVEVDSKVLLGLPFCDKASGRLHHSGTPLGLHRVPYR